MSAPIVDGGCEAVDRLVIGAGLSGLLAALRALKRGERVVVLERERRVGGVIGAIDLGGLRVDSGAEAFSVVGDAVLRLADELGVAGDVVAPQPTGSRIVSAGADAYPIPHGVLGIPASLDDPGLTEVVGEAALARARALDARPVQHFDESATVADVVTARLGEAFVARFVDPVCVGVHGAPASSISARRALGPVLEVLFGGCAPVEARNATRTQLSPLSQGTASGSLCAAVSRVRGPRPRPGTAVASLRGGLHRLPELLRDRVLRAGGRIVCGTSVRSAELDDGVESAGGRTWRVSASSYPGGAARLWRARSLSVAAGPAGFALGRADAGARGAGDVCASDVDAGSATTSDATLVLARMTSARLDEAPLGNGALVAPGSGVAARATTHVSAKWGWIADRLAPGEHIVRLSYGPAAGTPDADLRRTAAADIARLYGADDLSLRQMRVVRWAGALSIPAPEGAAGAALAGDDPRASSPHAESVAEALGVEILGPGRLGNGLLGIVTDHYRKDTA